MVELVITGAVLLAMEELASAMAKREGLVYKQVWLLIRYKVADNMGGTGCFSFINSNDINTVE